MFSWEQSIIVHFYNFHYEGFSQKNGRNQEIQDLLRTIGLCATLALLHLHIAWFPFGISQSLIPFIFKRFL